MRQGHANYCLQGHCLDPSRAVATPTSSRTSTPWARPQRTCEARALEPLRSVPGRAGRGIEGEDDGPVRLDSLAIGVGNASEAEQHAARPGQPIEGELAAEIVALQLLEEAALKGGDETGLQLVVPILPERQKPQLRHDARLKALAEHD